MGLPMPRSIPEWIGRTDDAMPPASVFDRLWEKQDGKDAITGIAFTSKDKVIRDHIVPLADGGENRESNLQLITAETHKTKTRVEATARAKARRLHERDRGYARRPSQWAKQRLGNGNNQRTATRPIVRKADR
jgi:5-methylcytosine-specific restriction protein A